MKHKKDHLPEHNPLLDESTLSRLDDLCPCDSQKHFGACCGRDLLCDCKSHFTAGECCYRGELESIAIKKA